MPLKILMISLRMLKLQVVFVANGPRNKPCNKQHHWWFIMGILAMVLKKSMSIYGDCFDDLVKYTLWWPSIASEHGHLWWVFPWKIVIFHSYVSFPEGISNEWPWNHYWSNSSMFNYLIPPLLVYRRVFNISDDTITFLPNGLDAIIVNHEWDVTHYMHTCPS